MSTIMLNIYFTAILVSGSALASKSGKRFDSHLALDRWYKLVLAGAFVSGVWELLILRF